MTPAKLSKPLFLSQTTLFLKTTAPHSQESPVPATFTARVNDLKKFVSPLFAPVDDDDQSHG